MQMLRTQVAIIGAGPGGLLLSHLLYLRGVDSIVLERRSRDYVRRRVRAGLLEQGTVDILRAAGLGGRLDRQGLVHEGFELRFAGRSHRIPITDLTGHTVRIYGQQEIVKDLIDAREASGGRLHFEVDDVVAVGVDTEEPLLRCTLEGTATEISCDFVAGCDGFHGVSRRCIPTEALSVYEHTYPFAWLGILAAAPPAAEELVYAVHEHGFALHSMRSPEITRLYLQVAPDDHVANWQEKQIWKELHARLDTGESFRLAEGPVLEKSITPLRSFVVEPMQYGRLFLAGDAAHIVPPTAAKGLNLAVADVAALDAAFGAWYSTGSNDLLDGYSQACLREVWQAQEFSASVTSLLHRFPDTATFEAKLQLARLDQLTTSWAVATSFAESYVGVSRRPERLRPSTYQPGRTGSPA